MPSSSPVTKGIGLILIATLGIVLMNTCAKMGGLSHGPIEMVFYRGMVALGLLVPYMVIAHPLLLSSGLTRCYQWPMPPPCFLRPLSS